MGELFVAAVPVQPGKSDRVRNFGQELAPHFDEWLRLSRETGNWTSYDVFLQPGPEFDIAVYVFEVEEPSAARSSFGDSPHDNWWVEYFEDVHGVNLREFQYDVATPEHAFHWRAE